MSNAAENPEPSPFVFAVGELRPGSHRDYVAEGPLGVTLDTGRVENDVSLTVRISALSDGVVANGTVKFEAVLVCHRCLTESTEERSVEVMQVFQTEPDEDGRRLESDGTIDLEPAVRDEVVLDLPLAPLCRSDCLGLCTVCGTDLNTNPCSGHTDEPEHPLAALRQLLDPQDT